MKSKIVNLIDYYAMKLKTLIALAAVAAAPALAQLAPPNDAGVSMGHIHLLVRDVDAQRKFWSLFGGTQVKSGQIEMIQFPGAYIILQKGEPVAGTVGSSINHFGFWVQNLADTLSAVRITGFKIEQDYPQSAFVTGPDEVRIELHEDKTLPRPIAKMHHIHWFVTAPLEVQVWYSKTFGATPGHRGTFDVVNLPGVELTLTKTDMAQAPTNGRALDHIGFEVKNLAVFAKKLEAQGIKFDPAPHPLTNSNTKIAFLTDPWGTSIELTENLAPQPQQATQTTKTFTSAANIAALIAEAKSGRKEGRVPVPQSILQLVPYNASLEYRVTVGNAAVHEKEAEVFYVVDGSATMITGGKLMNEMRTNAENLSGTAIEGGVAQPMAKGDFLIVPENMPHWFSSINGSIALMTLRVPRTSTVR